MIQNALINFDPYLTLGVDKGASQKDIKKAYYDLVKKYHPDVNKEKDTEKKFHKIQESYELLSDKEKRAQYDQFGANGFDEHGNTNPFAGGNPFGQGNPFGGNPFGGAAGGGNPFGGFGFEDLFRDAFRGAGEQGRQGSYSRGGAPFMEHVGDDVEVFKTISFKDAIFGTKVKVNYKAIDSCNTCEGTGLKTGKKKSTCPTCHGTGMQSHLVGGFHMASTCNSCGGSGVTVKAGDECGSCHGKGVEETTKTAEIDLPPGIGEGTRLRVPGKGDAPMFVTKDQFNRIKNGDLIIRVRVEKDPNFTRQNNNITYNHEILMTTAALGGEIIVPTIDGEKIRLKVRPGVQNGRVLTVPNKGVPINRNVNNRGDMDIVLNVKTLVPETPIQTALLEALAESYNDTEAKRTDESTLKNDSENVDQSIDESELHPSRLKKISHLLGKFFNKEEKK
ncbi:uncharacterized protein KQ657_002257 [Scheffersomyces spartinae]|uniref:DnaJ homolog 1, mitochondrial n=1 Tax=Scheffersomyces spartinae TaxID=45513 RepID=A0A9P8AKG4_9ASCO|nr:uncharacterized protein KQ657_002257 [Scheffersomyces spartinae]KAG7195872.1 hypothetical protein KQ657_002257 [Scheffersomyces spartinae]